MTGQTCAPLRAPLMAPCKITCSTFCTLCTHRNLLWPEAPAATDATSRNLSACARPSHSHQLHQAPWCGFLLQMSQAASSMGPLSAASTRSAADWRLSLPQRDKGPSQGLLAQRALKPAKQQTRICFDSWPSPASSGPATASRCGSDCSEKGRVSAGSKLAQHTSPHLGALPAMGPRADSLLLLRTSAKGGR